MATGQSLDEVIAHHAVEFADQIQEAAKFADKEEEIRIEAENLLAFVKRDAGVELKGRHEYTIAKGRADSVYQRVIIEYKNPSDPGARIGPGKDAPGNAKVVKQIKDRFRGLERDEGQPLNSLFGVGLDGKHFIFVTYRDNDWRVEDPVPVTRHSASRFLWALFNLGRKGKPYKPEYLSLDFGSQSKLAQDSVKALYDAICATESAKARVFLDQWKILFSEVCGYDVDDPSDKVKELASAYLVPLKGLKPAELFFALQTYFAIFMKILAAEIMVYFQKLPGSPVQAMLRAPTGAKLKAELEDLEEGGIFRHLNITNFLEGDLYAWYVDVWDESPALEDCIRRLVTKLDDYNPGTMAERPEETRDLLKKLYHELFPRKVRHDLGEHYTPDWLAEHVLNELGYVGDPDKRILDPACGSGTFLVMAINRIKQYFLDNRETIGIEEAELFQKIIRNVIGFDLNPLAVLAARTNYLIAVRDLLHRAGKIEIPVYLCDSILTPSEYGGDLFTGPGGSARKLKTAAGTFLIPQEIAEDRLRLAAYAEELERAVRNRYTDDEFIARLKEEGLPVGSEKLHRDLFSQLAKLNEEKRNGVWARIIKNAFAPLFIERVDYVAGNPPWVNWEHLPEEYRQSTAPLWQTYDLFRHKGYKAKLGGGKDDVSILMLYVAHDCYLLEEGKLGFVITQTVFKTTGGGEGFRTFEYRTDDTTWRINPIVVHDLSSLQPFEGATNRTAVVIVKKQRDAFSYPVPYVVWDKLGRGRISTDSTLADVERVTKCTQLSAQPVDPEKSTSPWLTVPEAALPGVQKVIGCSDYRAYEGVNTGGLNGCYWIRILEELPNGDLLIENLHDVGKIKVERVQAAIEPDLVYPLLRGRDVKRWHAEPSAYIILANETDRLAGIPESTMKQRYPKTYEYFKRFEGDKEKPQRGTLRGRSGFKQYFKPTDPFYSMYNVGPYTMSKWKVVWREQTSFFQAATIGEEGRRTVCPDHKLMLVACSSKREACYLTGMLNSSPSILAVDSYVLSTSTSTHVLGSIAIRKFQAENEVHLEISRLARERATAPRDKDREAWEELEAQINTLAAKLWGINDAELKAIQDALAEKERPKRGRGTKA